LTANTTRAAAREEREWAERQTARERQASAAATLDERVIEAVRDLPRIVGPAIEMVQPLRQTRLRLLEAWSRSTVLADAEIDRRFRALDMALFVAEGHAGSLRVLAVESPSEPGINPWPIHVALSELRIALAHFQRGEEPPPAQFPTAQEVITLAHPEGREAGLEGVRKLLMEREVTTAMFSG
jgi:hypothetical protein